MPDGRCACGRAKVAGSSAAPGCGRWLRGPKGVVTRLREHGLQPWLTAGSVVQSADAVFAEEEGLGE